MQSQLEHSSSQVLLAPAVLQLAAAHTRPVSFVHFYCSHLTVLHLYRLVNKFSREVLGTPVGIFGIFDHEAEWVEEVGRGVRRKKRISRKNVSESQLRRRSEKFLIRQAVALKAGRDAEISRLNRSQASPRTTFQPRSFPISSTRHHSHMRHLPVILQFLPLSRHCMRTEDQSWDDHLSLSAHIVPGWKEDGLAFTFSKCGL